ncbi:MAG TPA: hypothetical protein VJ961_04860 [Mariprofundaceae bacterium]|nr:hypothetical protein [Mariprofundaceae bacterium]
MSTRDTIRPGICHGPRCRDYGGRDLLAVLNERGIAAKVIDCQSLCPHSPVVRLPHCHLHRTTAEEVIRTIREC